MLGKLLLLAGAALWMAAPPGNTAKTRNTEDRLNQAMPRIPWPQNYDGPTTNNSYPPGNSSYMSGNSSYPTGAGVSGADNGWSGAASGYNTSSWAGTPSHNHTIDHSHTIGHSHNLGSFQSDFNVLRNSYSDTVSAFNTHIADHGNLVVAVQNLRNDHSNLLDTHNQLMSRLYYSNILH